MAEENKTTTKSTWASLWDETKEVIVAGVGAYKDIAGAKLTEAQAKALNKQKAAPNYGVIAAVVVGVVVIIGGIIWMVKRKK